MTKVWKLWPLYKPECANTLKKKGKSLKTTWSDEDFDSSKDDDDDYVINYVGFQVTSKKGYF